MPRITIEYDSDSDFEKCHLELATHQQIIKHYEKVKNSTKSSKEKKKLMLAHAMEKALVALKRAEDKLEKANQTIEDLKTEIGDQKLKIEEQKATIQKQKIMIDDQRTTAAQRDEENIVLKTIAMSIRVPNEDDDDDEAVIARGGPLSGSGFFGEGQKKRCGGTEEGMKMDEGARKKRRVEVYGESRKRPQKHIGGI